MALIHVGGQPEVRQNFRQLAADGREVAGLGPARQFGNGDPEFGNARRGPVRLRRQVGRQDLPAQRRDQVVDGMVAAAVEPERLAGEVPPVEVESAGHGADQRGGGRATALLDLGQQAV